MERPATGLHRERGSAQRGAELIDLVEWQVRFRPRYPGSKEHRLFRKALFERLASRADRAFQQDFEITLDGRSTSCSNLIGIRESREASRRGPLLLGTHFDTRAVADREQDPLQSKIPILGANDGGSGTAVLLHLMDLIRLQVFDRDILFVLFDAEDVGELSGNRFAMGSRYFAEHPVPSLPEEVIILDMVGGRDMIMNIDAHIYHHRASRLLTEAILKLAYRMNLAPFKANRREKVRYIVCDHIPFLLRGIPSCLLIDIDYPEWHTQRDLPEAMSSDSLVMIEDLLLNYLSRYTAS
jgi:glutaminyl-peptide cyclotransferase